MPKWLKSSHCKALRGGGNSDYRLLEPFSPCEEKTCHYEQQRSNPKNDNGLLRRAAKLFAMTKKAAFTLLVNALRKNLSFASLRCRFRGFCIPDYRPSAFTLSETLIVLSILGVIAAITVSSLVNNYQKTMNIVKLKKVYASLTQSFSEAKILSRCTSVQCIVTSNGLNWDVEFDSNKIFNKLKLFIPEIEKETNSKKCVARTIYSLDGTLTSQGEVISVDSNKQLGKYCMKNGIGLGFWALGMSSSSPWNSGCTNKNSSCGDFYIFLDGNKKRAVLGRNVFRISITSDADIEFPNGTCEPNTKNKYNGFGCGSRLIRNGWKMDY